MPWRPPKQPCGDQTLVLDQVVPSYEPCDNHTKLWISDDRYHTNPKKLIPKESAVAVIKRFRDDPRTCSAINHLDYSPEYEECRLGVLADLLELVGPQLESFTFMVDDFFLKFTEGPYLAHRLRLAKPMLKLVSLRIVLQESHNGLSLLELLKLCPNLQYLDLSIFEFSKEEASTAPDLWPAFPDLKSLEVHLGGKPAILTALIRGATSLLDLDLRLNFQPKDVSQDFLDAVCQHPMLKSLKLWGSDDGDRSAIALMLLREPGAFSTLTELDLVCDGIPLADIPTLPTLEYITWWDRQDNSQSMVVGHLPDCLRFPSLLGLLYTCDQPLKWSHRPLVARAGYCFDGILLRSYVREEQSLIHLRYTLQSHPAGPSGKPNSETPCERQWRDIVLYGSSSVPRPTAIQVYAHTEPASINWLKPGRNLLLSSQSWDLLAAGMQVEVDEIERDRKRKRDD